jgi:hypothetical protein
VTAVKKLTSKPGQPDLYLVPNINGHPIELTRADVAELSDYEQGIGYTPHFSRILASIDAMEAGS